MGPQSSRPGLESHGQGHNAEMSDVVSDLEEMDPNNQGGNQARVTSPMVCDLERWKAGIAWPTTVDAIAGR